jgi:hypothetical protein
VAGTRERYSRRGSDAVKSNGLLRKRKEDVEADEPYFNSRWSGQCHVEQTHVVPMSFVSSYTGNCGESGSSARKSDES